MKKHFKHPMSMICCTLFGAVAVLSAGYGVKLWFENNELKAIKALQPIVYRTVDGDRSFLEGSDVRSESDEEIFQTEKKKLIADSADFIEADLKSMKLTLYKKGEAIDVLPIAAKGKEGSWWETTTGIYTVGVKTANHFSSISRVWMPYGIQFYGNFFIHGWPYYSNGTPIESSYSGGCIRLATEDAKIAFKFAESGMPVLVFEEGSSKKLYEAIMPEKDTIESAPNISAEAAVIADLDTGEILLDKDVDKVLPLGALTKSMTALTASEVVNLERLITAEKEALNSSKSDGFLSVGKRYRGFDLLYPLLMQSSNDAASVIARFLGEKETVKQMNTKARALGMNETELVDATGENAGNVSTMRDLSRLAKYILDKRGFIFGVSVGEPYDEGKTVEFSDIQNFNPFVGSDGLRGVIGGRTDEVGFTVLTVWNVSKSAESERNVLIGVLGSNDANGDILVLKDWLQKNFGVK